jgi:hypothetical protein
VIQPIWLPPVAEIRYAHSSAVRRPEGRRRPSVFSVQRL